MEQPYLGMFVFAILIALVGALFFFHRLASRPHPLDAGFRSAGFVRTSSTWSDAIEYCGAYGGATIHQRLFAAHKNSPPELEIGVACATAEDFSVTRENPTDLMSKRLGLAAEVQTGDAAFDREFYLAGRSADFVAAMFRARENRDALRVLFAAGFQSVTLENGELYASKPGKEADLVPLGEWTRLVVALAPLCRAAESAGAVLPAPRGLTSGQITIAAVVAALVLMVLFMFALVAVKPLVDGQGEIFLATLPWSVLALTAGGALLWRVLRGRSTAHREFFLVIAMAVPFVPLGLWGSAMLVNERFDESPLVTHDTRVVGKYTRRSRGGDICYIEFESWRPNHRAEVLEVSWPEYRDSKERQLWRVHARAGRLGYEWVASMEIQR